MGIMLSILKGFYECVQDANGVRYVELLVYESYWGA